MYTDYIIIKFVILAMIVTITFYKLLYKKCETVFEKLFFCVLGITFIFIVFIFFLDNFNVPTLIGLNKNIYTQNWLNHLITLTSALFSEVLGGFILIYITKLQIDENNKINLERDKEERRINSMPLLTYSFLEEFNINDENKYLLPSIYEHGVGNEIVLKVKNIGINAIRKSYIEISGDTLTKKCYCPLDIQNSIDKGEEKTIDFLVALPINNLYKYNITIYYEDLLHNWYSQDIILNYTVTNITNYNGIYFVKYNYKIDDEKLITEPKKKTNIEKW